MKEVSLGFLVLSVGMCGCVAERSCPDGEHFEADACVPADGGMIGDDAPVACPVPCGGDTPHCVGGGCVACRDDDDCGGALCVEGACVACRDDADCEAGAPICETGACVSCDGRDCSADQIAAELAALVCASGAGAVRSNYEGIDVAQSRLEEDAFAALLCADPEHATILGVLLDSIRDGRTTVDLEEARACLDAARDVSGQFVLFAMVECDGVVGTVANSGACVMHAECASGYCVPGAGCAGSCAPQVAIGMPCDDDDAQCAGDARCVGSTCQARTPPTGAARDEPCSNDFDCLAPLVCRETSTCGDIPGAAMPCNDSPFTDCAAGTYCAGVTCQTRIAEGEPCTDAVACVAGTRCTGAPSRCLPVVALGSACGDDVVCPSGTACVSDVCTALPNLGESCSGACYRGTCVSGTCTSLTVGAPCAGGLRPFDALDPCGDGSTCRRTDATWTCEANVAAGATCGLDDYCDEPTEVCSNDTCVPLCAL